MKVNESWPELTAILGAMALSAGAGAEVIYDSFGPDGEASGLGLLVYGPSGGDPVDFLGEMAGSFSLAQGAFTLQSIALPLWALQDGSNDVMVSVYADEGGLPGALIESVAVADQIPLTVSLSTGDIPHGQATMTAQFSGGTVLTGGAMYWVGVAETAPGVILWMQADDDQSGFLAATAAGTGQWEFPFEVPLAMTVNGTAVPAPAAAALLALGLTRRRRRQ